MTVAISALPKAYPLTVEKPFRGRFVQVLEVSFTAANTDTLVDLDALAAADSTNGPAITTFLERMEKITGYFFIESPQEVAASGAAHVYNYSSTDPQFTFAGSGATPTVLTLKLEGVFKAGMEPLLAEV